MPSRCSPMAASLLTLHPVGLPAVQVRVIEYRLEPHTAERLAEFPASQTSNPPDPHQLHRLVTTLLDPEQYPALDLIECYHERWEIEACIDEQKNHLRLSGQPLPSQGPRPGATGTLRAPPGPLHRALVDASIRLRGQPGPRSPQLHARCRGLIPTCVLRDTSKMREVGHRTEAFRIGFQLIESVTYLVNHLIQRGKSEIRQVFFAHFFPYMFHGIQLWTVGRLSNQSHICRDLEIF